MPSCPRAFGLRAFGLRASALRAFTLIELLVVIGIIALLMSILLPTLAGARRTARATLGVANMRSLSQVMFIYTNNYNGQFLMPFKADWSSDAAGDWAWSDVVARGRTPEETVAWDFSNVDPQFETESFAYYWYSYMSKIDGGPTLNVEQFSPADVPLQSLRSTLAERQETREGHMLWPSSFLLSPTFWCSPSRYTGNDRGDMDAGQLSAASVASMTLPDRKVMLWERMDFRQTRRSIIDPPPNTENMAPAWNSPRARINAATGDGSVTNVNMQELLLRAAAADGQPLEPLGTLRAPDGPPLIAPRSPQPVGAVGNPAVGGEATLDNEYPLWFFATRDGIRGRDLP
ncbi:MAG TPA: type II secretion system protein [Phycisphaerales bacterium]|nr:type II secretion system protein [Phycisphaerales bacterium]